MRVDPVVVVLRTGAAFGGAIEAGLGFLLGWPSSASARGRFTDGIVPGATNLEGRARPERGVGIPLMVRKRGCLGFAREKIRSSTNQKVK